MAAGCSLQQVEQVHEHMGLAKTIRIVLGLEELLAPRVAVLSIIASYKAMMYYIINSIAQGLHQ